MAINFDTGNDQKESIFTDREGPRAAFWKHHDKLRAEMKEEKEGEKGAIHVHVLNYYGIGGIGKTSLRKELWKEIQEKDAGDAVCYDFRAGADMETALSKLRTSLGAKGFRFPLFDAALFYFKVRLGQSVGVDDPAEVRSLLRRYPIVAQAVELLDLVVPGLGLAARLVDKVDEMLRGLLQRRKKELCDIAAAEPEELKNRLAEYFGRDLDENMERREKPLTIFLTTYEKLVDPRSEYADYENADLWLRSTAKRGRGAVLCAKGVLWVILGREKLCWVEKDPEWEEDVERQELGELSKEDATDFLRLMGMEDETLRQGIYALTKGWPLYLNVCMNLHDKLREEGRTPELGDFGKDLEELKEKLAESLTAGQLDCAARLACLGRWTDELARRTVADRLVYDKVKRMSFVSETNGVLSIHSKVRGVFEEGCQDYARQETLETAEAYYGEGLAKVTPRDEEYAPLLLNYAEYGVKRRQTLEELEQFFDGEIIGGLDALVKGLRAEPVLKCVDIFLGHKALGAEDSLLAARLFCCKASACRLSGRYHEAKELWKRALAIQKELLGEAHPDTLDTMCDLAVAYEDFGEYLKPRSMRLQVLELRKRTLGEKHPDTISVMNTLAVADSSTGAETLREEVLKLRTELLGEDHPDTISAMRALAIVYSGSAEMSGTLHAEEYRKKAQELWKRMLELETERLGAKHPSTLVTMYYLANACSERGRCWEAAELREQGETAWAELLEEKSPETISAIRALADTYSELGETPVACRLWEDVLKMETQTLGEKDLDAVSAMDRLASLYSSNTERYEEAEKLWEKVLALRMELLGEQHPDTMKTMNNLVGTYCALGRFQEAKELGERVLALQRELLGPKHPDTLDTLNTLGAIYCELGEHKRGSELKEETLALQIEIFGTKHEDTVETMLYLSRYYEHEGDYQKASEAWERTVSGAKEYFGEKSPNAASAMRSLSHVYFKLGEYQKAAELMEQILTSFSGRGMDGMELDVMRDLAACYSALGQHQRAVEMREKVWKGTRGGAYDAMTTANELADAYLALGQYQKIVELEKAELIRWMRFLEEGDPVMVTARYYFALACFQLGRYQGAEELAEEVLELRTETLGPEHPDTLKAKELLASIREKLDRQE